MFSALVTQSCLTLCDPTDCSPPGFSVHGILQARILEWIAIPFSRGTSQPRDWTLVSCIAGRFFTVWATGKSSCYIYFTHYHSNSLILSQRLVPKIYRNPLGLFIIVSALLHFHWLPALPLLSVWLANFLLYLGNGIGRGFIKVLSRLLLPSGLKKKASVTPVGRPSSPEWRKGKSLDSIVFLSRKSRPEKYELTNRKK